MKSYADICLERASRSTEGPWKYDYGNWEVECDNFESDSYRDEVCSVGSVRDGINGRTNPINPTDDAEFIAHARTDVPELARRLKWACNYLRTCPESVDNLDMKDLADELERAP